MEETSTKQSVRHRSLLILESDQELSNLLQKTLSSSDQDVFLAADEAAAIAHLAHGIVPDLVILDLATPGNGVQFLDMVRRRYPSVKAIVMSNREDVDVVVDVMRLGALDFLRKPFDLQAIQVSVNEALQYRELERQVESLKRQKGSQDRPPFLYASPQMAEIMETVQRVAPTGMPVLITGESGVGKEVVAREIHFRSGRGDGPFVKVNCAALPASLLESELFGFEKGAFTGAVKAKAAKFEKAQDGTLFLDEIGELEHYIQAKFLHVLQDGTFTRLGSNRVVRSNARIVVATNTEMEEAVRKGKFRSDLYFRLNVIRIHVPPLRDRPADIPLLAEFFLSATGRKFGKTMTLEPDMVRRLRDYRWPGNVRELQNALSRYAVLGKLSLDAESPVVPIDRTFPDTPLPSHAAEPEGAGSVVDEGGEVSEGILPLKEVAREAARRAEREAILRVLKATDGNKSKAARILKVSYKALLYKIKECGIEG